jgi:putative zinc finger/helix-turn-helix YgiT family protein
MSTTSTNGPEGRCPSCGRQPLERQHIRDEFDYGPDDERVHVVAEGVPVLTCPACGEVFYGPEAEQAHRRAICAAFGLLAPEQIRGVRERLGRSQEEFSRLSGIGVATLSRWEQGRSMPTRALDRYLRVLAALPDAISVLEQLRRSPQPTHPCDSRQVTDEDRSRQAPVELPTSSADPNGTPEPRTGLPTIPPAEESAPS